MFLLDTCTLLWLTSDHSRLSAVARDSIAAGAGRLFVSAISAFEIAIKHRKGHLVLPMSPEKWFPAALKLHGLKRIVITPRILLRAAALPPHHNDPMDRIIMATAHVRKLVVLTPDPHIQKYDEIQTLW